MEIIEQKRHLDGRVERFVCRLVTRRPHVVIVSFDHEKARRAGALTIPAGSRTHGFFWRRRPYVLYSIAGPDGRPVGRRFDVVDQVRLGDREVSYLDLLLDVWAGPDGRARVEDEDEVAEFAARGLLTQTQRARIERTRDLLLRRHRAIARTAERLLS